MAEVTNELMFELMKKMHADILDLKLFKNEVRSEFYSVREHLIGLKAEMLAQSTEISNIYLRLGRLEGRMERVEQRLGLVDVDLN